MGALKDIGRKDGEEIADSIRSTIIIQFHPNNNQRQNWDNTTIAIFKMLPKFLTDYEQNMCTMMYLQ